MNILEDLWFGNISPWERPFRKDGAYAELLALVVRHQEDLLSRLNDEENAYSAPPEHPKPQPLCTETAQIAHRRRDHCASKTHAQVNPRRDFSTALAARSAGEACGKVSAAILPAASSMQPHHKQLCLRDHAHPLSHGFLAFNHDPIRIVHALVAYRIGNQRIPDLVTPSGNIKL